MAIEYNPRGEKRKNTQIREEDRKRIILENEVEQIKRDIKEDVQMGRGYEILYDKVKNCDDEYLQKFMLSLSDDDIDRICKCVGNYLNGSLRIENEIVRKIVEEDKYIKNDMVDVTSGRYSFDKIKNFLCNNDERGFCVAKVACDHLLPDATELVNEWRKDNIKRCLTLKRKIQKLKEGSLNDDDDEKEGDEDEEVEDTVSQDEDEEDEDDADEDDDEANGGESSKNENEDENIKPESSEDKASMGEKSNNGGKKTKKVKHILPVPGRDRPITWED